MNDFDKTIPGGPDRYEAYRRLGISDKVLSFADTVLQGLDKEFARVDAVAEVNQARVIAAMQKNRVNVTHFNPSTGSEMYPKQISGCRSRMSRISRSLYMMWQTGGS